MENVEDVLEHHGVKGQKWGVKKSESTASAGKKQVQHVLVDHAYAKRSAQIAGLSVAGIAAAALAPGLVPAAVVAAAGGSAVLSAKIALTATVATRVAYAHNYLAYTKRAKTRLAHVNVPSGSTVEDVYNNFTPEQKTATHILVQASSRGIEFSDNPDVQKGWASMSPDERSVVLFLANVADTSTVEHSEIDPVDAILEHHGTKGMKWGVRKDAVGIGSLSAPSGAAVAVRQKGGSSKPLDKAEGAFLAQHVAIGQHAALEAARKTDGPIALLNQRVKADFDKTGNWNQKAQDVYDGHIANHLANAAKTALKSSGLASHVDVTKDGHFMLIVGHPKAVKNFKKDVAKAGVALKHISEEAVSSVVLVPIRQAPGIVVGFKPTAVAHSDLVAEVVAEVTDAQQHGILGQKWGVRRNRDEATGRVEQTGRTGLVARSSSADQIAQDRIAKKLASGGVKSVSNADIQAYAKRLQLQKDLQRVLDQQTAEQKAKADGFVKSFVKRQAGRQLDRVVNKAIDIAVEEAIGKAGVKISGGELHSFGKDKTTGVVTKSKSGFGDNLQVLSKRIKPKKGG